MDILAATQVPLIVPAIEELLRELAKVNVTDSNIKYLNRQETYSYTI